MLIVFVISDEKQYQLDPDLTSGFVNKHSLNHNPNNSAFQVTLKGES